MGDDLQDWISIVESAGRRIVEVRDRHVRMKADGSPVTAADEAAHEEVVEKLSAISEIPIVSEESDDHREDLPDRFWILDPLDGTKELLKKSGEYTVNLALIESGRPVLGIVHLPATGVTYYTDRGRAWRRRTNEEPVPISVSETGSTIRIAVSRDHVTDQDRAVIEKFDEVATIPAGSSMKFCLVAEGFADLYVRSGRTMEWDIAAAHAVLEAAGGLLRDLEGRSLSYGKKDLTNPGFIAASSQELLEKALR